MRRSRAERRARRRAQDEWYTEFVWYLAAVLGMSSEDVERDKRFELVLNPWLARCCASRERSKWVRVGSLGHGFMTRRMRCRAKVVVRCPDSGHWWCRKHLVERGVATPTWKESPDLHWRPVHSLSWRPRVRNWEPGLKSVPMMLQGEVQRYLGFTPDELWDCMMNGSLSTTGEGGSPLRPYKFYADDVERLRQRLARDAAERLGALP